MNCEIIMNTGDSLYNSFGTGFEIGILDSNKKLSWIKTIIQKIKKLK